MHADINVKERAIRRLKIIEGQIRGLQLMVGKETYCVDVIMQSSAIKKALTSIEDLIIENHLSTYVIDQMQSGKEEQAVREVLKVYKLAQREK